MIDKVFKNKSGGYIKIIGATALDYRAQYLDDDSVEFSISREDLLKYWIDQGFTHQTTPLTQPQRKLYGNLNG